VDKITNKVINGKEISNQIQNDLKQKLVNLNLNSNFVFRKPQLVAVLVGNNPASEAYVGNKARACEFVGYQSSLIRLAETTSELELLSVIADLNQKTDVDGFIVQLPLPKHIDEQKIISAIDPTKDIDGFHPLNLGKIILGKPQFIPATPLGILEMLKAAKVETKGKKVVVIGRSNIVGTPISLLLSRNSDLGNATVVLCHSHTANLTEETLQADILIAAIGKPLFIKAEMVKKGAVVIDVGINSVADASSKRGFRLVGDVDFEQVLPICSRITPVPNGVGAMTVTALLLNTWAAFCENMRL
jgi:methylenetetrahydrofolate dehydrogenase (NADP+) / methenyltetrahydrofolate cyclohydrolase